MEIQCPKCKSAQMTKGRVEFPCRICGTVLHDPRAEIADDGSVKTKKIKTVDLGSVNLNRIIPRGVSQSDVIYQVYEKGWKDAISYIEHNATEVQVPVVTTAHWVADKLVIGHEQRFYWRCSYCNGRCSVRSAYCWDCGSKMGEMPDVRG